MSIDKLLHGLTESLKDEIPTTSEAVLAFTEACRWADNDPHERQRLSDIADLLDAEEILYAGARAALERGDQHTALPLLRQCAEAGTGEAHWLLAQLLEDLGHTGEAITWYQHAADDGDPRAAEKLAGLSIRRCLYGAIGYRRAHDKSGHREQHGKRRASRSNRRPVSRVAVPGIGRRFAVVAATAAVLAAGVIGAVRSIPSPVAPVPAPAIKTASLVTSMSDTLLFTTDSATLTSAAAAFLRPIAQQARSQHLAVSITGYASPGGTIAYQLALSEHRAAVIRDQLIALGVPAVQITQVTGDGAPKQVLNACRLDKTRCVDLHRVVIVLSPEAP